jgi:Fe-S cluster assembly ATP-binding protein
MLKLINLNVFAKQKHIIKNVTLKVPKNTVHALMGKNGSGKSTLAHALMGDPRFKVTGHASFNNKNFLAFPPEKRVQMGLFLSFQSPTELSGVSVFHFLRLIYQKHTNTRIPLPTFQSLLTDKMNLLKMPSAFKNRYLNEGFSGGEKKRMEMLQMLILEPKLALIDEVDSGLDIDAIKIVAHAINYLKHKNRMSVLIITHYPRILEYIKPDKISIINKGTIVKTGNRSFLGTLEREGYDWFN